MQMTFDQWWDGGMGHTHDDDERRVAELAWNFAVRQSAEICASAPDTLQNSTFDGAAEAIRKLTVHR